MREQEGGDRRILWALLIGGAGVVVAIVALVIVISANSATNDDAKIAKAVRTEENRQIGGVLSDRLCLVGVTERPLWAREDTHEHQHRGRFIVEDGLREPEASWTACPRL
jgi:hypothetical protein